MDIDLNPEQTKAVETTEGAVLVLSGAGTGKTRVLTSRLAYIISNGLAAPWECLAVTFTNRAATEMGERLSGIIGPAASQVWLGTFHRIGLRILRRHAELLGYTSNFTILGQDDQERLLKQIMEAENIDVKKNPPRAVLEVIQGWKDKGLSVSMVPTNTHEDFLNGKILSLYRTYQDRLKNTNAMDFGDLLLLCLELFKAHKDILEKYQNQFRYILVDEYQDTNVSQYLWLRLLAQKHGNICCVGDDDQSIYSWRGAEIGNILKFDRDFPNAQIIRLESNYRSTEHILGAASGLIRHNEGRLGKDLKVAEGQDGSGDKVSVSGVWDGREEASRLIEQTETEKRSGTPYNEIAVLVRVGFQTREFEEAFISAGIPYQVIGGAKFYDREEIRDAVAYLRILAQQNDDLALLRIINKPRRGIGDATIQILQQTALNEHISVFSAARLLIREESTVLKTAAKKNLRIFMDMFSRLESYMDADIDASDLAEKVLSESGYLAMWKESNAPEAQGRLENLQELIGVLRENFKSIHTFLEHVSLVSDVDDMSNDDKVSIMTLHAAKGLEFNTVFLPGWEDGIFPHQRALDEGGQRALEEERRLAYVGITRACKKVFISFAANRRVYNQWQNNIPSRFLSELPPEHLTGEGSIVGFKRQRQESFTPSRSIPWSSSSHTQSSGKQQIRKGFRVYHNRFGYGVVLSSEGNRLKIAFEDIGVKTIMADFVEAV